MVMHIFTAHLLQIKGLSAGGPTSEKTILRGNYFKDLCERNPFNPSNDLENQRLWLCFSDIIQNDLDYVKGSGTLVESET